MARMRLAIPHEFIAARARLTWKDVLFGLENEFFESGAAVFFAIDDLARGSADRRILELASLGPEDPTRALVESLARSDVNTAPDLRKWLYIALAWIHEHQEQFADPLEAVEFIYSDFDYPERMAHLVRYMPPTEPRLADIAANEQRLRVRWKEYLESEAAVFA